MDKDAVDKLLRDYIEVCNKALKANSHSFPYQQLMGASEKMLDNYNIRVAVYDDQPQACYALQFKDSAFDVSPRETSEAKGAWQLNTSYMKQVVENPAEYIKHPAKLDFDWLKSRMGF